MAHTMPVHAFADESRRGSLYFVAAAIAKPEGFENSVASFAVPHVALLLR